MKVSSPYLANNHKAIFTLKLGGDINFFYLRPLESYNTASDKMLGEWV